MATTSPTSASTTLTSFEFLNPKKANGALTSAKEQSDRFLKLLTTQLQNQDPLNPMDNAQMTSQMAQISTVSGIETTNASMTSLASQIVQLQALQGASMVGRDVLLEGDRLAIDNAVGRGSFELGAQAKSVTVEIVNSGDRVVDTVKLGVTEKGRNHFEWPAGKTTDKDGYTFRVKPESGTPGVDISVTQLMRDRVNAVNTGEGSLSLQLTRNGSVPYDSIKALN